MKLQTISLGLGGGSVLQIANRSHTQMMAYLVTCPDGSTLMIDSGSTDPKDGEHLYRLLKKIGRVDTWIITHAHCDHFGGLLQLLKDHPSDIEIGNLYFDFPSSDFIEQVENGRANAHYLWFCEVMKQCPVPVLAPKRGYLPDAGGNFIEIVKDLGDYRRYQDVNSTSLAVRLHFPKRDMLFLADLSQKAGDDLMKEIPIEKLRCDIVQMAHHGQGGVSEAFYRAVSPKICLYTAPDWLWENDNGGGRGSGPWKTLITRDWMEKLGVEASYPIADGDYLFI